MVTLVHLRVRRCCWNELQVLSTSLQTNQLLTDSQPRLIGLRGAICGPRLCTLDRRLNKHHTHIHTPLLVRSVPCQLKHLSCPNAQTHTLSHTQPHQWTPELDLKAGCGPLLITARPALVLLEHWGARCRKMNWVMGRLERRPQWPDWRLFRCAIGPWRAWASAQTLQYNYVWK